MNSRDDVTGLLRELSAGNPGALEVLVTLVYPELRRVAAAALRRERSGHTLQPTALVHETYLRLASQTHAHWKDRAHFFTIAAQVMRRILVDHSRRRQALKRGGLTVHVPLGAADDPRGDGPEQLLAVDFALDRLARVDPRQARIVELRFFGGLSENEVSALLEVSPRTIRREWRIAKAWLRREIATPRTRETI